METTKPNDFIRDIIDEDLKTGKRDHVATRFPPEPNGYLHIGHAKSICLNFGIAKQYNGTCNLRFDDTNPCKEDTEYVDSIMNDVKWLGFQWDGMYYASNYFQKLYEYAVELIKMGKAYVCELTPDQIREYRGTLTEPGKNSPYRDRSVEENLALFEKMKNGELEDGSAVLRAKIDMASPNINMRDPAIYRIRHATHHKTGDDWCIYPMYDFAHCLSDSIEGITHSICTLEFEIHRPLYNWYLETLGIKNPPQQIEFARLNITGTVMSKRKLLQLVTEHHVNGWDDPRMPTIAGMRRRGFTPEAIRNFCEQIGVAKADSTVDMSFLEHCVREDLNKRAKRIMVVVNPVKLIIDNYPEGQTEEVEAINNPENMDEGKRKVIFSKELYIDRDDFMEEPVKGFYRMAPDREVRLKAGYYVKCTGVVKDENGEIKEIHCTYDPETKGGTSADGRKVKGTLHWVSATNCVDTEVRLYENLFNCQNPSAAENFLDTVNHDSLKIVKGSKAELCVNDLKVGDVVQFERTGYFCLDKDSTEGHPVFNRTIALKDTWAKQNKK